MASPSTSGLVAWSASLAGGDKAVLEIGDRPNSAEVAILQGRVPRKLPDDAPPKGEQNPLRRLPSDDA
jgi:hypothetical protein